MKKWLLFIVFLLVGCTEQIHEPVRGQIEHPNIQDVLEIMEPSEVALLAGELASVSWEPNVEPEMERKQDVTLHLFISKDPNMPEYIITYRIWIENNQSLTLISTDENEGYGRMTSADAKELVSFLQDKIGDEKSQ